MARPNKTKEKRAELLPIVAAAFSELGYRKATTKALAGRCGVQENILYRLWADKKAMFVASIDYLFDATMQQWQAMIDEAGSDPGGATAAERVLAYDAAHRGESGFYRITFAALSETDDPDVRAALRRMYRNFSRVIEEQIADHRTQDAGDAPAPHANAGHKRDGEAKGASSADARAGRGFASAAGGGLPDAAVAAWALLGVATAADIGRETGLLSAAKRKALVAGAGRWLLEGRGAG